MQWPIKSNGLASVKAFRHFQRRKSFPGGGLSRQLDSLDLAPSPFRSLCVVVHEE